MNDEKEYCKCRICNWEGLAELVTAREMMYGTRDEFDYTRVLDVGSGSGAFLFGLAKMGFINLIGCDPFIEKDLEYANGIKIYKKEIHEMDGQYDYIYFNDSFEHVQDPHEVLESAKKLLASGGVIRIELPVYPI